MERQPTPKRPLDQVRDALRMKHYSCRTDQAYIGWLCPSGSYVLFHGKCHPNEMAAPEVEASRSVAHLAVKENAAASTQSQALSALLFLHREVLHKNLGPGDALRAERPERLPTVLTQVDMRRLLAQLSGTHGLMAKLPRGSGQRPAPYEMPAPARQRSRDVFPSDRLSVDPGSGAVRHHHLDESGL